MARIFVVIDKMAVMLLNTTTKLDLAGGKIHGAGGAGELLGIPHGRNVKRAGNSS